MSRYMTKAKSLAFLIAFGLSALTGLAEEESYLYWMIDPDAISLLGDRWSTENMTIEVKTLDGGVKGDALVIYYGEDSSAGYSIGGSEYMESAANNVGFYAALGQALAGHSYVIEIFNGDNSVMTTESISYGAANAAGNIVNLSAGQGLVFTPWMAPAPEPNSALLLLLGCAVLGLKRKKA